MPSFTPSDSGPVDGAGTRKRRGTERVRLLLVHAKNVPGWKRVVGDTISGAFRIARIRLSDTLRHWRYLRFLVAEEYATLSYLFDWRDAFLRNPDVDIDTCNITNLFEYSASLWRIPRYDLIVILHSAAGDNMNLLSFAARAFETRRCPVVVFFGNEYSLMPDKIRFAQRIRADYIASQLPSAAARWLYQDCPDAKILSLPAALNPKLYSPLEQSRSIDIGFRGALYQYSIGDNERSRLLKSVKSRAADWGIHADIEFTRFPASHWSDFLNSCKAIVGAEAGTYFLERDDRTQNEVEGYILTHPKATFEEVYERFFRSYPNPRSGKAISSRHFEAIGTKTCQILLEGHYNGILKPDEHYIAVKKDLSNLKEALERFRDEGERRAMVDRTWEYVMDGHTYDHRVAQMVQAVSANAR